MKLLVLLEVLMMTFASDKKNFVENGTKSLGRMEASIAAQIEEDEYVKINKRGDSKYIGAIYKENNSKWEAHRWSINETKLLYSGYYKDEETAAHASDTLARKLIVNGEKGHMLNFPDDESEVYTYEEISHSIYIGVSYNKRDKLWRAVRHSKNEKNKSVHYGYYKDEEAAAHASDTLARKLMTNGEQGHKLNFPDDESEVHPEGTTSIYIGVSRQKRDQTWGAQRWSKNGKKVVSNGTYQDEETAAHASDTLARKLITSGEKEHKLNFPDDYTEVYPKHKLSKYFGIYYHIQRTPETWEAQRFSKNEKKLISNGTYKDEETAARASDTLARKLMKNGEKDHKLNFPDDHTEVHREKANYIGVRYNENRSTWGVSRRSKKQNKMVYNGTIYKDEKTAAHASDTLARKLIANGEKGHKLNFPDDNTEIDSKETKRKRQNILSD